jgi:hypothetical protein
MEYRFEERLPTSFDARVTDLENVSSVATGRVIDISRSGICVAQSLQFRPGNIVKLEIAESVLFGHVVYCNNDGSLFQTGIEITRVLLAENHPSQRLQAALIESMPATPGLRSSAADPVGKRP